jgi:hypothetical protein
MAVIRTAQINIAGVALTSHPIHYLCDTTAELPTSGLKIGDTALTKDTNTLYRAASATTWTSSSIAANSVGNTELRDSAATSVMGRSANTIGDPADIHAADNDTVFGRFANVMAFATVPTAGITDNAVTFAKMQTITTARLLGRNTAGTGNVEQLAIGTGLALSGTTLSTSLIFTKGVAYTDATAVVASTIVAWVAPFSCTVTAIKGYRVGGTGATINAYRGTTATPHRSANLSLTSASTWMDGGAVQNTAYVLGDSLLFGLVTVTGSVTQVNIQLNLTRP